MIFFFGTTCTVVFILLKYFYLFIHITLVLGIRIFVFYDVEYYCQLKWDILDSNKSKPWWLCWTYLSHQTLIKDITDTVKAVLLVDLNLGFDNEIRLRTVWFSSTNLLWKYSSLLILYLIVALISEFKFRSDSLINQCQCFNFFFWYIFEFAL